MCLLDLIISFAMLGKFSTIISSKIFSYPFIFYSSSGTPIIQMLVCLILSQRSLRISSVLFILFTLYCSSEVISTILSSSSLIHSSASDILLLIPSRVFLISVIVLSLYVYSLILLFQRAGEAPAAARGGGRGRSVREAPDILKKIIIIIILLFQFSSVAQSCLTLCNPMNHSTPGLPIHHQLPEFTQTHIPGVGDAIQPSHPLSSPSPPAPNPSQRQSLFQ